MNNSTCINGESNVTVVKYNNDYAYCLHLKCTNKKDNKVLYETEETKGSCSKFQKAKAIYKYNNHEEEYDVIDGDDAYKLLSPRDVGFEEFLKNDQYQFDKWDKGNIGEEISISGNTTINLIGHKYKYKIIYEKSNHEITESTSDTNCICDSNCILKDNGFKYIGHTFLKWHRNSDNKEFDEKENVKDTIGESITKDNEEVILTTKYRINKISIYLYANSGNFATTYNHDYTKDSNGKISYKNEPIIHSVNYNGEIGSTRILDWNNQNYLNLVKKGHIARTNEEWNTKSDGTGTSFKQNKNYKADELCSNIPNGDCTLNLYVNWIKDKYKCEAGYYLKESDTSCTICPKKSYCPGGEYYYNTTTDQGINACPNGYVDSPEGSSKNTDCYKEVSANHYVKNRKDANSTACSTGYLKGAHRVYYDSTSKCNPKKVEVTFDCNGGSGGGKQTFTYGASNQQFTTTCKLNNRSLHGWKHNKNGSSNNYTTDSGVSDNWINSHSPKVTLYAHWVTRTIPLSFPYYVCPCDWSLNYGYDDCYHNNFENNHMKIHNVWFSEDNPNIINIDVELHSNRISGNHTGYSYPYGRICLQRGDHFKEDAVCDYVLTDRVDLKRWQWTNTVVHRETFHVNTAYLPSGSYRVIAPRESNNVTDYHHTFSKSNGENHNGFIFSIND